jgi:peptide/nickel transport system ATP-binding protein
MLEVQDLSVSFARYDGWLRRRSVRVLDGVAFAVERGEVHAVIGASGAGKSILAQAILGLLPPNARTDGFIRFDGDLLTPERLALLRGRRIALVPQSVAALDPSARAGRQVAWAARRAGAPRDGAGAADAALGRFGLDAAAGRLFPHQLSGGMARRVLLAIASVGGADLVISDEPTTGLDPENKAVALAHLRALADRGRGVVVVTHDLSAVLPVADRVTILRDGTAVETADAAAFEGRGGALRTDYARALWRALPRNDFTVPPRWPVPAPAGA